jgi:hypothetical protein
MEESNKESSQSVRHLLPRGNMRPLIDGDWFCYRACSAVEYNAEDEGKDIEEVYTDILSKFRADLAELYKILGDDQDPIPHFFFSHEKNFRTLVAIQKEYKGNRLSEKPRWYDTLVEWVKASYPFHEIEWCEADDALAIYQTWWIEKGNSDKTIIISVDKDLRQIGGWHYSPELWNAKPFGPKKVEGLGEIELVTQKSGKKIVGTGLKFFYSQILTGDTVDNIPGLDKCGPVAAMNILEGCTTEAELYKAVRWAYRDVCWEPDECLLEQARLVWMVKHRSSDGKLEMWNPPEVDDELL